jgi:hypothetical protein
MSCRTGSAVLILCVPVVAASCQRSEGRFLERQLVRDELVGHFIGTPFAMESLKYAGFKEHLDPAEHQLELGTDGTCRAQTFIDPTSAAPNGTGRWIPPNAPCRWALDSDGRHQQVTVTINVAGDDATLRFYLDEEAGHLVLWQYTADPDSWKYMEFRRVENG